MGVVPLGFDQDCDRLKRLQHCYGLGKVWQQMRFVIVCCRDTTGHDRGRALWSCCSPAVFHNIGRRTRNLVIYWYYQTIFAFFTCIGIRYTDRQTARQTDINVNFSLNWDVQHLLSSLSHFYDGNWRSKSSIGSKYGLKEIGRLYWSSAKAEKTVSASAQKNPYGSIPKENPHRVVANT